MRSFSLFALAAAVLAPFVAAAPTPAVDAVAGLGARSLIAREPALPLSAVSVPVSAVPVPVDVDDVSELVPRGGQKGIAAILVGVKVDIAVYIEALNCLTAQNATTEVITPILEGIVTVIAGAVVELKALVGADISVILCSVDGTVQVTVAVIAQLLAEILCLIFGALGFVLTIVADVEVVIKAVVAVAFGDCICGLINAILALVAGLLVALVPLIGGLLVVILKLKLVVVAKVLALV